MDDHALRHLWTALSRIANHCRPDSFPEHLLQSETCTILQYRRLINRGCGEFLHRLSRSHPDHWGFLQKTRQHDTLPALTLTNHSPWVLRNTFYRHSYRLQFLHECNHLCNPRLAHHQGSDLSLFRGRRRQTSTSRGCKQRLTSPMSRLRLLQETLYCRYSLERMKKLCNGCWRRMGVISGGVSRHSWT